MAEEVKIQALSAWQDDDCPHRRPGCTGTASKEAVAVAGRTLPHVRTCGNQKCIEAAKKSVLSSIEVLAGAQGGEKGKRKKHK